MLKEYLMLLIVLLQIFESILLRADIKREEMEEAINHAKELKINYIT